MKALPDLAPVERNDKNVTENQVEMSCTLLKLSVKIREFCLEIAVVTLSRSWNPALFICRENSHRYIYETTFLPYFCCNAHIPAQIKGKFQSFDVSLGPCQVNDTMCAVKIKKLLNYLVLGFMKRGLYVRSFQN